MKKNKPVSEDWEEFDKEFGGFFDEIHMYDEKKVEKLIKSFISKQISKAYNKGYAEGREEVLGETYDYLVDHYWDTLEDNKDILVMLLIDIFSKLKNKRTNA